MPTSKLTRVRVEGFSKTSATTRPASGCSASGTPFGASPRAAFIAARVLDDRPELVRRRQVQVEEVPHATAASTAAAAASSRRSPSSASASLRFSGGSSRTTLSAAPTTSTRAS